MSSNYSANQYDSAFRPNRMQNWCETKPFKERPAARVGRTAFIADDKGHLLPGAAKRGSTWPDFKGTWDLPARIPAQRINPTARSMEGLSRLRSWGFYPQHTGSCQPQRLSKSIDGLQDAGTQDRGPPGRKQVLEKQQLNQRITVLQREPSPACPVNGNLGCRFTHVPPLSVAAP
ncbi:protein Flattop [Pholidichthys leucotaenia]